jgi:PhoPQ-activated pathogenicity-related protein
MDIDHPKYQVPLQDPKGWRNRYVHVSFTAGMTNTLAMVLEPKGADYIGTAR